jgi:ferritin-like metal-binding protein YciE
MAATTPTQPHPEFLKQIFLHHLNRIYNGKSFLRDRLNQLVGMAAFKGLNLALEEFGDDVVKQLVRMEEIYALIGEKPADDECNPIRSIVQEEFCIDGKQTIPVINDLDIMLYVQVLEHINITSYRMLKMLATTLKYAEIKQLLTENFDESTDNDKLFTLIAKEYIDADI